MKMKYKNIREEELKNKVGADWFVAFDTSEILGNIDFTVLPKQDSSPSQTQPIPLLWAEAKTGDFDIPSMFVQLILTIGKARTFDKTLPPAFLGAFDFKKIVFVDYNSIQDIFFLNDFNWNVTPSKHDTKEFKLIKERIESLLKEKTYVFDYLKDENELKTFIKNNVAKASTKSKIKIDKNNFIPIYLRWIEVIKPIIDVSWDDLKKNNILDSDFYLADLFVDDKDTESIDNHATIRDNLFVIFQNQGYKIAKENIDRLFDARIIIGNKDAYVQFWKRYKRPPIGEFQDYIIERRDLLVPQDIRERKGAFFTPRIWVELSQKYLTDYLGKDWQDEYYIWDCAAGTGNLLAGLSNKYNIYASTLDQADVNVMHERIQHGANLLKNHVFQFDFLNDEFVPQSKEGKMPDKLFEMIHDEEKRKKLVVYINPPYAEAGSRYTIAGTGLHKQETSTNNNIYRKYKDKIGRASNELFTQFLTRIYAEIPMCKIANFSKLKNLQSSNFKDFRNFYQAKLEKIFLAPADTFDNVKGKFPIGFFIWNLQISETFQRITSDVYSKCGEYIGGRDLSTPDNSKLINIWIKSFNNLRKKSSSLGKIGVARNDIQNKSLVNISHFADRGLNIANDTLIVDSLFFAVQVSIKTTWLNDRDQFLFPNNKWESDTDFQNNCLAYTLFHGQNRISSKAGTNHWIPFTEQEVDAKDKFESHFMTNFMSGKIDTEDDAHLFGSGTNPPQAVKRTFSKEAKAVFDAGRALWTYYHSKPKANVNASLYDIREYFQGRNDKGRMNSKSDDETYTKLIGELRNKLNSLADRIKPKVYEYEFLKE